MKDSRLTRCFLTLFVCAALLPGCGDAPGREVTYEGKTVSEWLKQVEDKDGQTSAEAEKALMELAHDSDMAREYMTEIGNEDAELLKELVNAIGDGKSHTGGEENYWMEFMDACHSYIRLGKNWWIDSDIMIELGTSLESLSKSSEIDEYSREFFTNEVRPIMDSHLK